MHIYLYFNCKADISNVSEDFVIYIWKLIHKSFLYLQQSWQFIKNELPYGTINGLIKRIWSNIHDTGDKCKWPGNFIFLLLEKCCFFHNFSL